MDFDETKGAVNLIRHTDWGWGVSQSMTHYDRGVGGLTNYG